jgi:hypothetical protein
MDFIVSLLDSDFGFVELQGLAPTENVAPSGKDLVIGSS